MLLACYGAIRLYIILLTSALILFGTSVSLFNSKGAIVLALVHVQQKKKKNKRFTAKC